MSTLSIIFCNDCKRSSVIEISTDCSYCHSLDTIHDITSESET